MLSARSGSSNRWLVLTMLSLIAIFNYVDRIILSILQVPIKAELGLSDSQLGALTGLAFALFYTTMGVPLGRLGDRVVRKYLIAIALVVWSAMTAMTGLATGFFTLLLLRIGVAIGEAGLVPATHSMISDLFTREKRATALSIWGMSAPIGTMIGLLGAGWLAEAIGWRHAFLTFGLTGIALAPLLLLTVREPERGRYDPPTALAQAAPPMREALAILWHLKSFRYAVIGGALTVYVMYSMKTWNPPFYARVHGMTLGEMATLLGLATGIGGAIGIFAGGTLADLLGRRFPRGYLLPPLVGMLAVFPLGLLQYSTSSVRLSLVLVGVNTACTYLYFASIVAVALSVVSTRMRALTSSVIVLVVNLFGMGLGPLATGAVSDLLGADAAGESLRTSLMLAMIPALASAWLYWLASGALGRELPAPVKSGKLLPAE